MPKEANLQDFSDVKFPFLIGTAVLVVGGIAGAAIVLVTNAVDTVDDTGMCEMQISLRSIAMVAVNDSA